MTPDGRHIALARAVLGPYSATGTAIPGAAGERLVPRLWRLDLVDVALGKTAALDVSSGDGTTSGLVAISGDGTRLVSVSGRGTLQIRRLPSGEPVGAPARLQGRPLAIALTRTGDRVAVGLMPSTDAWLSVVEDRRGSIAVMDAGSNRVLAMIPTPVIPFSLAFTPDGTRLVCGLWLLASQADASVPPTIVFDVHTGKPVATLAGHGANGVIVAVSPDGSRLLTAGSTDQTLRIWDARRYELLLTIRVQPGRLLTLAVSADGERIAAVTSTGAVCVWDAGGPARLPGGPSAPDVALGAAHSEPLAPQAQTAQQQNALTADELKALQQKAEQGDAEAQCNLGVFYRTGQGVPLDLIEAVKWSTIAMDRLSGDQRKANAAFLEGTARMLTAERLAEAQRRASEWTAAFEKRKK
jgi:sugar lactone lactonase YvrE